MSKNKKVSYKAYFAWNYQEEIEDLNRASEQGWQLEKGGCYHSRFVKDPAVRYRYQLDFRKVDNMGRYLEMFEEQGWEYVNSTFNNWHYFRKFYDPSLPEEEYEIFTDRESIEEMTNRIRRTLTLLGSLCLLLGAVLLIFMLTEPKLPTLFEMFVMLIEGAVLLRGAARIRKAGRRSRVRNASVWAFLVTLLVGFSLFFIFDFLRPTFSSQQNADSLSAPIVDNRWVDFDVKYPDSYYLDLEIRSERPLTFRIVNEAGEAVYEKTDTEADLEDVRVKLSKGKYWFSMSCDSGFDLKCSIE